MSSSPPDARGSACPNCGVPPSGHFCANCGTALDGAACNACRTPLTAGGRFCHRCGTPVGAAAARAEPRGSPLPWAVAGIALLALIALVAGRNFGASRGSGLDAPKNAIAQPGLDGPVPDGAGMRAPDISRLSPEERAARLFNRVMLLHEQGKADSVQFFAPMALSAYQMLGPLNLDQRYDLGRIGEVSGALALARAQADTMLASAPTHLLGLTLAANAAAARRDHAARGQYERRLLAAYAAESARALDEYTMHRIDIDSAVARARRRPGA